MSARARIITGAAIAAGALGTMGGERLANFEMNRAASHNPDAQYCTENYQSIVNKSGGAAVERCVRFEDYNGQLPDSAAELRNQHYITQDRIDARRWVDGATGGVIGVIGGFAFGFIITLRPREQRRREMLARDKSLYHDPQRLGHL